MEDTVQISRRWALGTALALWLAASVAVLYFTVSTWEPGQESDAGVAFVSAMLLLTFPAGLLVPAVVAGSIIVFGDSFLSVLPAPLGFGLLWLGFVVLGYVQWFKLAPGLWSRIRRQSHAV